MLGATVRELWRQASCTPIKGGYSAPALLDVIRRKTEIWAKRTHQVPQSPGSAILRAAISMRNQPHIIDCGGALGTRYFELRGKPMRWSVVERPVMVAQATPTEELRFYTELSDPGPADIVYSAAMLNYLPDPLATARQIAAVEASLLILDRQYVHDEPGFAVQYSLLNDNGPGSLDDCPADIVAYPFAYIQERALLESLSRGNWWQNCLFPHSESPGVSVVGPSMYSKSKVHSNC